MSEDDTHFLEFWPNPENYDNSTELRKQYCTGIEFVDWVGAVRKQYELYDNKICTGDEAAECHGCMEQRMARIGYRVVVSRGDAKAD